MGALLVLLLAGPAIGFGGAEAGTARRLALAAASAALWVLDRLGGRPAFRPRLVHLGMAAYLGAAAVSNLAAEPPAASGGAKLVGMGMRVMIAVVTRSSPGREALLRYVLRPPVAQERVEQRPFGLVRITLKKAYPDGTIAVDMDSNCVRTELLEKLLEVTRSGTSTKGNS